MVFLDKIRTANYVFNQHADSSLIAKINFFDNQGFVDFIGSIPLILSAPISLFFNLALVIWTIQINHYFLIGLGLFLTTIGAICILNKFIIDRRIAMNICWS